MESAFGIDHGDIEKGWFSGGGAHSFKPAHKGSRLKANPLRPGVKNTGGAHKGSRVANPFRAQGGDKAWRPKPKGGARKKTPAVYSPGSVYRPGS